MLGTPGDNQVDCGCFVGQWNEDDFFGAEYFRSNWKNSHTFPGFDERDDSGRYGCGGADPGGKSGLCAEGDDLVEDDRWRSAAASSFASWPTSASSSTTVNIQADTALNNERNDLDIMQRRLDASVLLIKALGGGWDTSKLPKM